MKAMTVQPRELVRVHIRWMIRRDMPEVLEAEQQSFDYSWTEEDFLRCLPQRNRSTSIFPVSRNAHRKWST